APPAVGGAINDRFALMEGLMPMSHTGGARPSRWRSRNGPSVLWRRTTSHPATGMLAVAVRAYLAYVWLRFGLGKIETGWLTSNPLRPLVRLVADGQSHAWLAVYEPLARWVLDAGADRLLAAAFPLAELAIAAALATGVLVRPAAALATLINLNLVLAGLSPWRFDGRIIALQLALLAVGMAATRYGVRSLRPLLRLALHRTPAMRPTVLAASPAPARNQVVSRVITSTVAADVRRPEAGGTTTERHGRRVA
ncbi:MAG TPA: hypothetical protein VNA89_11945, partial [Gemmatimonadaceae bacterium]|nr:hypothetical protein [Gemmatimonadaceae bacterium]